MIGSRFIDTYDGPVTKISYRDEVKDIFEKHENSCLLHFAWSSTTRNGYDDLDKVVKSDVINSNKLFNYYYDKNPNGRIIFLSSAGGLHANYERTVSEDFIPFPTTLYGDCKLQVENILRTNKCSSVILRVSNVWGGTNLGENRVNGLVDKLIKNLDTDNITEIYTNLDTRIDIIHIDDLINLIIKVIHKKSPNNHEVYLVGSQSLTIKDVIDKISSNGFLLLKFNKKYEKSYLHVENSKVRNYFDWKPEFLLQ